MEHISEQELLQLIRSSDYTAFEELHHRYYKSLYALAAKKIGNSDDAYDLLQDMFIELWEKRANFVIKNPLANYLRNRLWFKLSGYFRTKGFQEKHFKNFSEFLELEHSPSFYLDEMEVKEIDIQYEAVIAVINQTIAQMPDKMREVFLLSRSKQYTVLEIAERLNISPKTVRNQTHIALDRIRKATANFPLSTYQLFILILLT